MNTKKIDRRVKYMVERVKIPLFHEFYTSDRPINNKN